MYFVCYCDCMWVHLCKLTSRWTKTTNMKREENQKHKNIGLYIDPCDMNRSLYPILCIFCIQYICRSDLSKLAWHSICGLYVWLVCSMNTVHCILLLLHCEFVPIFAFRIQVVKSLRLCLAHKSRTELYWVWVEWMLNVVHY